MIAPHKVLLWAAVAACNVLALDLWRAQAAPASNFATINYTQSLPPLSVQSLTNGVRLRFAGNPSQRFTIQRAPAPSGPWTNITTRTAPSSALLQFDDTNRPPVGAFYRTAYTNSGTLLPPDQLPVTSKKADYQIAYGQSPDQKADLWVPPGDGPHPVVILIHGGCWQAGVTLHSLDPMADVLKTSGFATWNIEYRRLGQAGAGWPGTFLDIGTAVDLLRTLAPEHRLDLGRVIVMGHSAGGGGLLAMWVAARSRLPAGTPLYVEDPLRVSGVINLSGGGDMQALIPFEALSCGGSVVEAMLGGTPAKFPERYAQTSALKMLPIGTPQVLIWGDRDDNVPLAIGEAYTKAATEAGDPVLLVVFPGLGHFETASPLSPCWPVVRSAIDSLLENKP
jgi:acetyl esterase/lipase